MPDPRLNWLKSQIDWRLFVAQVLQENAPEWPAEWEEGDGRNVIRSIQSPPDEPFAATRSGWIAEHIAMNDPEFVIASCKAELDLLELHRLGNVLVPGGAIEQLCQQCKHPHPCPTIRLIASGYRHRPGWEGW